MNKILVIVFDNESQARQGHQALIDLHEEGAITVHNSDIVAKDNHGQVDDEEPVHRSTLWYGLSPVIAGLVGMLGGALGIPLGASVGAGLASIGLLGGLIYGSFVSSMVYFAKMGGHEDFVNEVADYLQEGRVAVIADVDEHQTLLTDTRLKAAGGVVFRQPYSDAYFAHLERDMLVAKAEITALCAEHDYATDDETRVELHIRIKAKQAKLQALIEQAVALEEATERIGKAKVESLTEQMEKAHAWWISVLQERIIQVQDEYKERLFKLRQARLVAQAPGVGEQPERRVW